MRKLIVFIITASALSSCAAPLKEAYKDDFLIGGAIGSRSTRQSYVYPIRQQLNAAAETAANREEIVGEIDTRTDAG